MYMVLSLICQFLLQFSIWKEVIRLSFSKCILPNITAVLACKLPLVSECSLYLALEKLSLSPNCDLAHSRMHPCPTANVGKSRLMLLEFLSPILVQEITTQMSDESQLRIEYKGVYGGRIPAGISHSHSKPQATNSALTQPSEENIAIVSTRHPNKWDCVSSSPQMEYLQVVGQRGSKILKSDVSMLNVNCSLTLVLKKSSTNFNYGLMKPI